MPTESSPDVKFEIGHVLFIDIVGYSKLLIDEQKSASDADEKSCAGRSSCAAEPKQLLRLPTGDGGAWSFAQRGRAGPVRARDQQGAQEASGTSGADGHSQRAGERSDRRERASNIAGAGINMAQRVMDCGDAGHILLSQHVADDLVQYRQWAPRLRDLGECEVKHGVRVSAW